MKEVFKIISSVFFGGGPCTLRPQFRGGHPTVSLKLLNIEQLKKNLRTEVHAHHFINDERLVYSIRCPYM